VILIPTLTYGSSYRIKLQQSKISSLGNRKKVGSGNRPFQQTGSIPSELVLFVGINHLTYGKENNMEAGTMIIIVGSIFTASTLGFMVCAAIFMWEIKDK